MVSLLVDLQCFYDSVELERLLELWEPLNFPPGFMNFTYEAYTGPRLLQGEQQTSKPVHCARVMLAGGGQVGFGTGVEALCSCLSQSLH